MMFRSLPALLVLLVSAAGASAQSLKPGLWEISSQMQGAPGGQMAGAMAEMQKQMANMPPEQRKMVEDMMAKRGASLGQGGGVSVQMCMTPEMAERNEVGRQQGDCSHTASPRSGNTLKFAFTCTKPPSRGEGQVTFTSPEAYAVKVTATTTLRGKEETVDLQSSGKWLASDCGSVKPLGAKK